MIVVRFFQTRRIRTKQRDYRMQKYTGRAKREKEKLRSGNLDNFFLKAEK